MDGLFQKLGIYDFMGIWAPGAIISVYCAFTLKPISSTVLDFLQVSNETALVLLITVVSYVVGVILHEAGKIFTTIFHKSFDTELRIMPTSAVTRIPISPFERIYYDYCKSITDTMDIDYYSTLKFDDIYSQLKYSKDISTSRIDKYHSIYGLARGLFIGVIFHTILSLVSLHITNDNVYYIILIADILLALLFLIRTKRYFHDWVKNAYIQYSVISKRKVVII